MVVEGGGLIGTTVSHNDVLELPASGMRAAYKARDTRLGLLAALNSLLRELTRGPIIGTLCFHANNPSKAVAMYEDDLAVDDHSYVSWGNLATAYHALRGRVERAHAAHARAATLAEEQQRVNASDPRLRIDLAGYCGTLVEQQKGPMLLDTVVETNSVEAELAAMLLINCGCLLLPSQPLQTPDLFPPARSCRLPEDPLNARHSRQQEFANLMAPPLPNPR
jgi:hypothetical protein